jgi:hypothetical protein
MRGRRGNPFERAFHLRACGPFPLHSSPRPLIVLAFPLRRGEAAGWLVLSIRVFPDHRPLASRLRGSKIEYELEYEYDFKNDCEETGANQIPKFFGDVVIRNCVLGDPRHGAFASIDLLHHAPNRVWQNFDRPFIQSGVRFTLRCDADMYIVPVLACDACKPQRGLLNPKQYENSLLPIARRSWVSHRPELVRVRWQ